MPFDLQDVRDRLCLVLAMTPTVARNDSSFCSGREAAGLYRVRPAARANAARSAQIFRKPPGSDEGSKTKTPERLLPR